MARSEMKRFPEPWMIEKAKKPRWGYTHGLVVKSNQGALLNQVAEVVLPRGWNVIR